MDFSGYQTLKLVEKQSRYFENGFRNIFSVMDAREIFPISVALIIEDAATISVKNNNFVSQPILMADGLKTL